MAEETRAAPVVSIAQRAGYGAGLGVLGVIALAWLLAASDHPVADLVLCTTIALIFGVLVWLTSRRDAEQRVTAIDRLVGADRSSSGFRNGLLQALVVAGFIGLVLALVMWAFGADQSWEVVPSIMLGSALWMALEIRDLRRVESHA